MQKKTPEISVIVTAYNVERYITRCLESILSQDFTDSEVIVVLDKPTDSTEDIVRSIAEKDKRVRILANSENAGAGLSRRYGIAEARGEYIMLVDGDDWLRRGALRKLRDESIRKDADIVSGHIFVTDDGGQVISELRVPPATHTGHSKVLYLWRGKPYWFINCKLIRRSVFQKMQYCHRRYIEDSPSLLKMLYFANKVVYLDDFSYYYRMNPSSLTHTCTEMKHFIFHALAWLDMIDFLSEHDAELLRKFHPERFCAMMQSKLEKINFTAQDIEPYRDEFTEMCIRYFNTVKILSSQVASKTGRLTLDGELSFVHEALNKFNRRRKPKTQQQ